MKITPIGTQKKIRLLRKSGLTHRQIAKKLGIGQGTAVKYSPGLQLTTVQKNYIKLQNYNNSLGKLTKAERKNASRKGGLNTQSHFPIKYSSNQLITILKSFAQENGRLPTKRDFVALYRPILRTFNTWNNAIQAAGFDPNPVRFSKKILQMMGINVIRFQKKSLMIGYLLEKFRIKEM